jgi:hypothetical protein
MRGTSATFVKYTCLTVRVVCVNIRLQIQLCPATLNGLLYFKRSRYSNAIGSNIELLTRKTLNVYGTDSEICVLDYFFSALSCCRQTTLQNTIQKPLANRANTTPELCPLIWCVSQRVAPLFLMFSYLSLSCGTQGVWWAVWRGA